MCASTEAVPPLAFDVMRNETPSAVT